MILKNKMFAHSKSNVDETKRLLDHLSKTLRLGEQIQKEKLTSDEEKRRRLNEIKNRIELSLNRYRNARSTHCETSSSIGDLKIDIQREKDKFVEKLSLLESSIKKQDEITNADQQRLNLIVELQRHLLKKITSLVLVLRDNDVRPCRDDPRYLLGDVDLVKRNESLHGAEQFIDGMITQVATILDNETRRKRQKIDPSNVIMKVDSNQKSESLHKSDLFIKGLVSQVSSILDDDKSQEIDPLTSGSQVSYDDDVIDKLDENEQFLSAMELTGFDYHQFNF